MSEGNKEYKFMIERDGVMFNDMLDRVFNSYEPRHIVAFIGMLYVAQHALAERCVCVVPAAKIDEVKI